jgi:DNA-binding response OmpR family regulator
MRILYIDDDPTALEYVGRGLGLRHMQVESVPDGQAGLERALSGAFDLIVLDVMLPDMDGFSLIEKLRAAEVDTPVLFLSARGEASDRIRGLELGADDYLAKPFAFRELVARIHAIARRRHGDPEDGQLRLADLVLDTRRHAVERGEHPIELTPRQFTILELLLRNCGRVLSRPMILEKVWGYGFESQSNAIDVHINALRRKVDVPFASKLIHTVKGVGYVLEDRRARGAAEEREPA